MNSTIGPEKHEEMATNRVIEGLDSDAQEPLDLADQWSRFDQHIVVGEGWRRLSEATT